MIDYEEESRTVRKKSPSKVDNYREEDMRFIAVMNKDNIIHRKKYSTETVDVLLKNQVNPSANHSFEKIDVKNSVNFKSEVLGSDSIKKARKVELKNFNSLRNETNLKNKELETDFPKIRKNTEKYKLHLIDEDDKSILNSRLNCGSNSSTKKLMRPISHKLNQPNLRILNYHEPERKINFSENDKNIFIEEKGTCFMSESALPKGTYIKASTKVEETYSKSEMMRKITSMLYKNIHQSDLSYFLMNPLPKNKTLLCKIKKVETKFLDKFYPRYDLYLNSNGKFLLSAQKVFKTSSSTYLISRSQSDFDLGSENYVGKISSNFLVTEFNFFGRGKKPTKETSIEQCRTQYGSAIYDVNLFGLKGPRKLKVYLPEIKQGEMVLHKPKNRKEYIQNLNKTNEMECSIYMNKPPVWNDLYKSYMLKFNGRVQLGSSKNFQLIKEKGEEIYLQFGMVDESTFAMDFQYPLSPFQAFSICLSSLATKKVCE